MKKFTEVLQDYDFIVEVRNFEFSAESWQSEYLKALAEWDYYDFDKNSIFKRDSKDADEFPVYFASYQFFEASELEIPKDKPEQLCDFTSHLWGYFGFKIVPWYGWRNDIENLIIANLKESMGLFIGHNRSQTESVETTYFPCVNLQRYDVDLNKYHFEDGAVLLSRDDQKYCNYVVGQIEKALRAIELFPLVFVSHSCHNPFHYGLYELAGKCYQPAIFDSAGKIVSADEVEPILRNTFVELWTFDFTIVEAVVNNCEATINRELL